MADIANDGQTTEPPIDPATLAELQALMGEDFELLLATFFNDSRARLAALYESLDAGAFEDLAQTAHSFKGSGINMGAQALSDQCQALEWAARHADAQTVRQAIEKVERAYEAVCRQLEELTPS